MFIVPAIEGRSIAHGLAVLRTGSAANVDEIINAKPYDVDKVKVQST